MTFSNEVELALVRKDVEQIRGVFVKLDTAIEKIGEVSNSIARMLAVHEERLGTHDRTDKELFELLDSTKEEFQDTAQQIERRILDVKTDMTQKFQTSEHRIMQALEAASKADKDSFKAIAEQFKAMDTRIAVLEKWKWVLMGGGAVIGFMLRVLIDILAK